MFLLAFRLLFHPISIRFHKDLCMLWLMTMGRRLNGVYAAFMLVAFMMGVAGALQAPTLSLFLSREVGRSRFGWACSTPSTPLPGSSSACGWRNDPTAVAIAAS